MEIHMNKKTIDQRLIPQKPSKTASKVSKTAENHINYKICKMTAMKKNDLLILPVIE